jgi:TatD DNase family protein
MQNNFVDMHCHLDLLKHIDFSVLKNVDILSVTTTPYAWAGNQQLFSKYNNIKIALGFHPQLVNERIDDFNLFEQILPKTRYVGEIGLDGSAEYRYSIEKQKDILESILKLCSKNNDKILSIHSRGAVKETLDLLEKNSNAGKFILHWFSGTIKELERAIQLGCWFSINNNMLLTKKGIKLVQAMPIHKILTETDTPFNKFDNVNIYNQIQNTLNALRMIIPSISKETIFTNFREAVLKSV